MTNKDSDCDIVTSDVASNTIDTRFESHPSIIFIYLNVFSQLWWIEITNKIKAIQKTKSLFLNLAFWCLSLDLTSSLELCCITSSIHQIEQKLAAFIWVNAEIIQL